LKRKCWHEARTRPSQSAELPNEPHLPPNCGHGDPSLSQEGGGHKVLRKDNVEIGNSGLRLDLYHSKRWLESATSLAEIGQDNQFGFPAPRRMLCLTLFPSIR
jgi:hypothetical protein